MALYAFNLYPSMANVLNVVFFGNPFIVQNQLLDGGAHESKTLKSLVAETSGLLPVLPRLEIRGTQVLDLCSHLRILNTRLGRSDGGGNLQRATPCRTDFR